MQAFGAKCKVKDKLLDDSNTSVDLYSFNVYTMRQQQL